MATAYDNLSRQTVPAGTYQAFSGGTVPPGYLLCNGAAVSRTTYAILFGVIGTTYGVGDGSTTFNLPNAIGRSFVGAGTYTDPVEGSVTRTLGASLGASQHLLSQAEMPSHTHTQSAHRHSSGLNLQTGTVGTRYGTESLGAVNLSIDNDNGGSANNGNAPWGSSVTPPTMGSAGSSNNHNNMQPSLVCTLIIKS